MHINLVKSTIAKSKILHYFAKSKHFTQKLSIICVCLYCFSHPWTKYFVFRPIRCADEAAREERVPQAGGVGAAEGGGVAAAAGRVQPRADGGQPDRLQHPAGPHGALVQRRLPRSGRPGAQLARPARRPHRDAAQAPLPRPQEDGAAQT